MTDLQRHGGEGVVMQIDEVKMIDVRGPDVVEVSLSEDGMKLWVNINGVCFLRVQVIGELLLSGLRKGE